MDAPHQKFVAIYELDSPEVVNSDEWSVAVEKGKWGTHVREHTSERSHFMYESCWFNLIKNVLTLSIFYYQIMNKCH